jgi:hypothetical protein
VYHKNFNGLIKSRCTPLQQGGHFTLTEQHLDSHLVLLGFNEIVDFV